MHQFWSDTPDRINRGDVLPLSIDAPDLANAIVSVRVDGLEVVLNLDEHGRGSIRVTVNGEGLKVCTYPGVDHHGVYVGVPPDDYVGAYGKVIIPPNEDPGEDPDPALSTPAESSSEGAEADEMELKPGEERITLADLDDSAS